MKIRLLKVLILVTALLSTNKAFPQFVGEPRVKSCLADALILKLDTLSIVPNSFSISGVDTSQYRLDPIAAKLYLRDSTLLGQMLVCQYTVYRLDFSAPVRHRPLSQVESAGGRLIPVASSPHSPTELYDDTQLSTSGQVSRGITIGNNQDPVLNSSLNLQVAGNLSEDFRIMASISDKDIPIQPEGNTRYLSDINNVFITLYYKDVAQVNAGDICIQSPVSDFLSVSRNLLGMDASVRYTAAEKIQGSHSLGGGVAKGSFARQKLPIQNGMQGPYKLYGAQGETGIVIIAGSERVYIDGVLLVRGQENDYVMDYNTAEITFTPARMMSAEKRVFVEFEYTNRHFTRMGLFSYNELLLGKRKNLQLNVNYYCEQDLRNQSVQPELNQDQMRFLSLIGDNWQNAYYEQADSTAFSEDRVLYCRKDTLVDGITYHNVYEYSTDRDRQLYSVSFTYMGPGKGSYVLLRSAANGRVFSWVAPMNGELQGDYNPVLLLSTPQRTQMTTLQAKYQIRPTTLLRGEVALSEHDLNLFSRQDDRDNVGFASSLNLNHRQKLGKNAPDSTRWDFFGGVEWQFIHKNFQAVESFRDVEFARTYNLEGDHSNLHSEQMLHALLGFEKSKNALLRYDLNWFTRFGNISALRQELVTQGTVGRLRLNARAAFLTTTDSLQRSRFLTTDARLAYRFKKVEIGVTDLLERNLFRDATTDTVRSNSYAFNELLLYIKNNEPSLYKYNISYKNRVEFAPDTNGLQLRQTIQEANALFQFDRIKNQHFAVQATYRTQKMQHIVPERGREHYFVGNMEYTGRFFHNVLLWNTYYEAGSCMEQKKTFTFLKVATGQGTHVWHDYNGNGVEEMDEFEVAAFQDEANYVKVWLTGNDYVNAYSNAFTQSIQLRPAAVWSSKKGFRRFLARFSDVASFRTQLRHVKPNFNPFYANLADTNLLGRTMNLNNTFSFNNSTSKFAFDFVVQKSQNKSLMYYGFEQAGNESQQVVLKSNLKGIVSLEASYLHGIQENRSDFLTMRNYVIERHETGGKVQLRLQDKYVTELGYLYGDKRGVVGGGHIRVHDANAMFNYKIVRRGVATVSVRYVAVGGQSPDNAAAAYQMLEGLSLGHNVVWSLGCQLALTEYLQLSAQYDGRVSQGHKAIHTGGITLKAQF